MKAEIYTFPRAHRHKPNRLTQVLPIITDRIIAARDNRDLPATLSVDLQTRPDRFIEDELRVIVVGGLIGPVHNPEYLRFRLARPNERPAGPRFGPLTLATLTELDRIVGEALTAYQCRAQVTVDIDPTYHDATANHEAVIH